MDLLAMFVGGGGGERALRCRLSHHLLLLGGVGGLAAEQEGCLTRG